MMFTWPISIYYEDTDAGGVVYHSNYLNFFERARSEWLYAMNIKQATLLEQDVAFVVKKADIDFIKPAKFEQKLLVNSRIQELKRASMVFDQELVDADGQCYCRASIVVVCVALSKMRPKSIPQLILQEFQGAR
ncbi:tol-pal system-associated acyl-CoA thioesterase [Shewanella marina]|uniref:tol-pal system-associated acyl-CoA thioesterase n=1 Tax=Shewanella marina TaxID=487319 RepID=UPI0004712ECE|nr:tol-pal system-associated acyl-CoA thioesterase [Shewanella marina]